jgi:hypothetical protein
MVAKTRDSMAWPARVAGFSLIYRHFILINRGMSNTSLAKKPIGANAEPGDPRNSVCYSFTYGEFVILAHRAKQVLKICLPATLYSRRAARVISA